MTENPSLTKESNAPWLRKSADFIDGKIKENISNKLKNIWS